VAKSGLSGMTVGGVKKISLWKYEESYGEWVECPNLPISYMDVYLERGFRKSPPEAKVEAKVETFSEAVASGLLAQVDPPAKKLGRPKKV